MHVLDQKGVVSLVLVAAFYGSTIPAFASTDANDKSESPAKREAAKVEAPAPLTERERWLLDRVEELEKRVADIESKGNAAASSAYGTVCPAAIFSESNAIGCCSGRSEHHRQSKASELRLSFQ